MKTNITNLMNLVSEYDRKLSLLTAALRNHVYTTTIKELDGTENIVENYEDDFKSEYEEYLEISNKIMKIKKIIYSKNNELKLPDGSSIQDALVEVTTLRKKSSLLELLLTFKKVNKRVTEVNNSYFECKELNFNNKDMKNERNEIDARIREIEFEISKLNSLEFEVEI